MPNPNILNFTLEGASWILLTPSPMYPL